MKSSKVNYQPKDAEKRKAIKPVICYPIESLKPPPMEDILMQEKV